MPSASLTLRLLITSVLGLAAAQAGATCYTVYDAAGQVMYQSDEAPASAAQAGTVPDGGRVVLSGAGCSAGVAVAEQVTAAPEARRAPLLTHVHIAASARTPYAVVGRDIAVVAPANADQVWQRMPVVDNTAPRFSQRRATETVITEWADGRVEVEQRPVLPRY